MADSHAHDWLECADDDGHVYYFNKVTEECVWEKPAEFHGDVASADDAALLSKMHSAFDSNLKATADGRLKDDAAHQKKVADAKAAQAEAEAKREAAVAAGGEHWVEVYDPDTEKFYYYGSYSGEVTWEKPAEYVMAADDELMHAVIVIQTAYRGRLSRRRVNDLKLHAHDWLECADDDGHVYYFNKVTEECVWEKPAEFHGDVASADDAALLSKMHSAFDSNLKATADGRLKDDAAHQKKVADAKAAQAEAEAKREAAVAAGGEHWVEVYDPDTEKFYYYGSYSGEVTWEKPAEYVMAADDELMHAVIVIQTAYRGRLSRRRVNDLKLHAHDWLECADDDGHVYYFNKVTEECVWEKPAEFHGDVASADDAALLSKMHSAFDSNLKATADGRLKDDAAHQKKVADAKAAQAEAEAKREAAVAAGGEHWVEVYDPDTEKFYYYGSYSGEVTWEKPAEYVMAADDELMHAVIVIQTAYRGRFVETEGETILKLHAHDWLECADDDGHVYYFNKVTEECVWEKPAEFHGDVASADDAALLSKMHSAFDSNLKATADGRLKDDAAHQKKVADAKAAQAEGGG